MSANPTISSRVAQNLRASRSVTMKTFFQNVSMRSTANCQKRDVLISLPYLPLLPCFIFYSCPPYLSLFSKSWNQEISNFKRDKAINYFWRVISTLFNSCTRIQRTVWTLRKMCLRSRHFLSQRVGVVLWRLWLG